eukprot:5804364-Pleurochrysis_carterae.AAC.1
MLLVFSLFAVSTVLRPSPLRIVLRPSASRGPRRRDTDTRQSSRPPSQRPLAPRASRSTDGNARRRPTKMAITYYYTYSYSDFVSCVAFINMRIAAHQPRIINNNITTKYNRKQWLHRVSWRFRPNLQSAATFRRLPPIQRVSRTGCR